MKRVLILPAGTEISFEIFNALKYSKFVELYGGTSIEDHSEFVYKNLIKGFPFIDDLSFLPFINHIISEYKIDCVYPAHDSVSMFLSKNIKQINAQVIITEETTTAICRSKKKTYDYFKDERFIPTYYDSCEKVDAFPVFVKPTVGQGSQGARIINNRDELIIALEHDPSLVICEYLSGEEYTVDCFTDRFGKIRVAKLRDRERIKSGISVRSKLISNDTKAVEIAEIINSKLKFRGAWFFQLKKNSEDELKLLEISPRIPGTMGLSRNCGINFPMLTLFDFWGYDVEIIDNQYDILLDRAFYSAFRINIQYDHIYLDYDDTLIVNEKVNIDMIRFLYQAIEQGKKIHLLTKHIGDLFDELDKYRISPKLFDEILWIRPDEEKTEYIYPKEAIFIDDSFAERKRVKDKFNIPVFDVDMVEGLLDWSV